MKRTVLPILAGASFSLMAILLFRDARAWDLYTYLRGGSRDCSLIEALQATRVSRLQMTLTDDAVKAGSRMIRSEADGTELWTTPDGDWWVPKEGAGGLLFHLAEQRRDIYRTAEAIRPGDVVLDCGANIGVFTRKALKAGASRVIAIEPAPDNLAVLKKNLAEEIAQGRVTVVEKGVWDKEDVLTMYLDDKNPAANSFVRQSGSPGHALMLPLTTIDLLVAELGLERVDYIKMDIEGAERQALLGGTRTIQRFHPRMELCLYHLPDDSKLVPPAVVAIDPAYRMECDCVRAGDEIFPQIGHFRRTNL